jgi:hypothetical protein
VKEGQEQCNAQKQGQHIACALRHRYSGIHKQFVSVINMQLA